MTDKKKIIINEVKNSGLILEPTQPKDYNANDNGILVEQVPGKVINVEEEDEKPMGGVITPLVPPSIIFPDGHGHLKYQGAEMMQFNPRFDSFSCVLWAIAKATCYDLAERYGIIIDIEEMFNAFYANVRQGVGTTVRAGMESFRLHGWTEYGKFLSYKFDAETTLRQFQAQPPQIVIKDALGNLTKWKFNWEVVGKDNTSIINGLQRTVIIVTGFAWAYDSERGVYLDYNNPANHAFLVVDYEANKNLKIDDSYPRDNRFDNDSTPDEFIKIIDKNFSFMSAHRAWLTPILPKPKNNSLMGIFNSMFLKISRAWNGAFFFIKDNKKASITDWKSAFGAVIDEVGILPEHNNMTNEKLNAIPDFPFFGKQS